MLALMDERFLGWPINRARVECVSEINDSHASSFIHRRSAPRGSQNEQCDCQSANGSFDHVDLPSSHSGRHHRCKLSTRIAASHQHTTCAVDSDREYMPFAISGTQLDLVAALFEVGANTGINSRLDSQHTG